MHVINTASEPQESQTATGLHHFNMVSRVFFFSYQHCYKQMQVYFSVDWLIDETTILIMLCLMIHHG